MSGNHFSLSISLHYNCRRSKQPASLNVNYGECFGYFTQPTEIWRYLDILIFHLNEIIGNAVVSRFL